MSIVDKITQQSIGWSRYPKFRDLPNNRLKAYLVLYVSLKELNEKDLTATEIAKIISKKFRKTTSHQAIRSALNSRIGFEVDTIIRETGETGYILLPEGIRQLGINECSVNEIFSEDQIIIPSDVVLNSKDYLKKIVFQINGCYRDSYFDACAVMIRKLFETLIIELYEIKKIENKIKDKDGSYFGLNKLIKTISNENMLHLSSQTKNHLSKIKLFGDTGAHARKINLRKNDIDFQKELIRLSAEELLNNA